MFREIHETRQRADEPFKRWFSSLEMDLFVWLDGSYSIVDFHFTYNKPHDEKALVWNRGKGFSHFGVDDGSRPGKHPGSPLLVQDGVIDPMKIVSILRNDQGEVPPWIKNFIIDEIEANLS